MIAIVDYGVGNLFSLKSSFAAIGESAVVTGNEEEILKAEKVILPGVGAFGDAIKKLEKTGLDVTLKKVAASGKPIMGICLGMQLLFDKSYEFGEFNGLGLIKGKVKSMSGVVPKELKIPQIGWNSLDIIKQSKILKYTKNGDYVYFVHSFYATECGENVVANTDYGYPITAIVEKDNVYGCQFHPEKSGTIGLKILKAFCEIGREE